MSRIRACYWLCDWSKRPRDPYSTFYHEHNARSLCKNTVCQLITEEIIYREFDNKLWRDQCFCFWLFCAVALYFIIQNFLKQKQNVTCLTLSTVDNSAAAPERLFNAPSHSGEEISCWYFHKISVLKPNHERGEKPVWFAELYSIEWNN